MKALTSNNIGVYIFGERLLRQICSGQNFPLEQRDGQVYARRGLLFLLTKPQTRRPTKSDVDKPVRQETQPSRGIQMPFNLNGFMTTKTGIYR